MTDPAKPNEWSLQEVQHLRTLVKAQSPVHVIALKLGRGEPEVRAKASEIGEPIRPGDGADARSR